MDAQALIARLEGHVRRQLAAVVDPEAQQTLDALLAALEPALRDVLLEAARQAAAEVGAQLPDADVEVVFADGDPELRVRPREAPVPDEGYEARLTLRLPPTLKARLEQVAEGSGDSINAWVVKALAGRSSRGSSGNRVQRTFRT